MTNAEKMVEFYNDVAKEVRDSAQIQRAVSFVAKYARYDENSTEEQLMSGVKCAMEEAELDSPSLAMQMALLAAILNKSGVDAKFCYGTPRNEGLPRCVFVQVGDNRLGCVRDLDKVVEVEV